MSDGVAFDLDLGGDLGPEALDAARSLAKLTRQMKSADKQMKALRKHASGKLSSGGVLDPNTLKRINSQLKSFRTPTQKAAEATKRLRVENKRLAQVTKMTSIRMNQGRGAVRRMGSSFKGLGRSALGVTAKLGLVAAAGAALTAGLFTKSVFDMGNFSQDSNNALALLTGSKSGGREAFEKSVSLSRKLGLNIKDTTKSMQKLLAQQFSLGESENLIKLGSDLKAIGANAQDVQGVIRALTQIRGKGRLQGDEMVQLAEAGISRELIFQSLEKQFGKDRKAIQKMQEAGKVDSNSAIKAVEFAILAKTKTKKAGQAGAKFAESTLSGAMGVFGAEKDNFLLQIAEGAAPAFKSLARVIGDLGKAFSSSGSGATFTSAFKKMGEAIENMRPNVVASFGKALEFAAFAFERLAIIGPAFLGGFFTGFVDAFGSFGAKNEDMDAIVRRMTEAGKGFGDTLGQMMILLPKILPLLESVANIVLRITNGITSLLTIGPEAATSRDTPQGKAAGAQANQSFKENLNGLFGTTFFTDYRGLLEPSGANVVNGMIAGMDSRKEALRAKSAEIAAIPSQQFVSTNEIRSPSKLFRRHAGHIVEGQVLGFSDNRRKLFGAAAGASAGVASAGIAAASASASKGASVGGGGNTFNQTFRSNIAVNESQRPGQTANEIAATQSDGMFGAMVKSKVAAGVAA